VNADGSLTLVGSGSASQGAFDVVFDRTGKYVYVENRSTSQMFAFAFDPTTGALGNVAGSPFSTKAAPYSITTAGH
jgi:6-phosphogluconolactonase (cycloisomerase 2 family)